jgi:benzoate-CoA ligase
MAQLNLACALVDEALERGRGEAAAIREPKRVWTYGQLAEEVMRYGAALVALGIKPGERVALFMHDSAELAAAFLGALRMGAVPVPINTLLRSVEVRLLLGDSGATAAAVSGDLTPVIEEVRAELPNLRHLLAIGGARPGETDFHRLTREVDPVCAPVTPVDGAPAFLLYSAGAGSAPRGVAHTHAAVLHAYEAYAQTVLGLVPSDRVFATVKLSTAYGLGLGLLFPLRARAATFLLPARARPRNVFDVMAAFHPTVFAATPSLYGQMLHDYLELSHPLPSYFGSVRHAISGAEALPSQLARRAHATFGVELLHGFGTTEGLHFVLSNQPDARREGSCGRPLPGVEARIVDDAGRPMPPKEIGALEVRGPTVARGYFGRLDESGGAFHEGWVRTGDRFFADEDGYYYYCGRADDLFKVSGRWVAPDEVERTLLMHPAVWECAVVEGHDEDGLAQPVAFVVPNVGHAPTAELGSQLMEFVKREIAPYKYPRQIEFVESLPRGQSGRILRWRLRQTTPAPGGTAE